MSKLTDNQSKYNHHMPKIAKKLLKLGWKINCICEFMEITHRTWDNWMKKYLEFREAVNEGKSEFATEKVENKLIKRCMGYNYIKSREEVVNDVVIANDGSQIPIERLKTVKQEVHVPPNVSAISKFLAARMPDKYGKDANQSSGGQCKQLVRQDILELTPQERMERLKEMLGNIRVVQRVGDKQEDV